MAAHFNVPLVFFGAIFFSATSAMRSPHRRASVGHAASDSHAASDDPVACPVLSALKKAGHLNPDSEGRVSGPDVKAALIETGCSSTMSAFQADGIFGFGHDDVHQASRSQMPGSSSWWIFPPPLYANVYTMNSIHACNGTYQNTTSGFPCNINTEFQQHGYSTRVRDPAGGRTPEQRFSDVFEQPGVLERIAGVSEKVMTVEGLAKVLARARASGDHQGEFSLNASGGFSGSKVEYFHPEFGKWNTYKAASQWQAITAWSGFFLAFGHETNGVRYMTEGDLRSFIISGSFPAGWQRQDWGFGSCFRLAPKFKGKGVGDEWIAMVEQTLESAGYNAWENTYSLSTYSMMYELGAITGESNSNPAPAQ